MQKYAFFGGSFNPPTYAHLEIAKIAIEEMNLDKVFLVPVGNSYNKPGLADENERYKMLKIMCENQKNIDVENIELERKEGLRAYQALDEIDKKYNKTENYFIMGADNFIRLPNWENAEYMLKKYKFIIFNRGDIDLENQINNNELIKCYKNKIRILTLKNNKNCSSGLVRSLIKEQKYEEAKKYTKEEIIDIWKKFTNYLQKT